MAPHFEEVHHPVVGRVVFTRDQARGAWANGTRVSKCGSVTGDHHQDGALATVVGSMGPYQGRYGYFVEWDDLPGWPVGVSSERLTLVEQKEARDAGL